MSMMRIKLENQIKILERMEIVANWMMIEEKAMSKEDKAVKRHLKNILRHRYRKIKRQAARNIEGELCDKIFRLKDYDYYKMKATNEVRDVFKDSTLYGAGLELKHVFNRYKEAHGCGTYKGFLRRIHEFDGNKSGFRYLRYLDDLRNYLISFIGIKYPKALKKAGISKESVVGKMDSREFIEMEDKMDRSKEDSGLMPSGVYCVPCQMEVSRNVFKYHVNGKKHLRKKGDSETLLRFRGSISDAEGDIIKMLKTLKKERRHSIHLLSRKKNEDSLSNDIPRWLFRQRELDVMFSCDICGYSGNGKEPFQSHFSKSKHVEALKMHGVEDYGLMMGVTKVSTLMRIKKRQELDEGFEEEFEDDEGNVFDKRTYEDLKRNNLI